VWLWNWSCLIKGEHRLRESDSRALWDCLNISGFSDDTGRHCMMRSSVNCTLHRLLFIVSGSTALVRTLVAAHLRFRCLIKTPGRSPLYEWSARRKGLYLHRTTQHRNTKTNIMHRAVFEATIPVTARALGPAVIVIRMIKWRSILGV
jgi:hypothetical protein